MLLHFTLVCPSFRRYSTPQRSSKNKYDLLWLKLLSHPPIGIYLRHSLNHRKYQVLSQKYAESPSVSYKKTSKVFGSGERDEHSANRVRLPLSYQVFLSPLSIPALQLTAEVLDQGSDLRQVRPQLLTVVWILALRVHWALELFLNLHQRLA